MNETNDINNVQEPPVRKRRSCLGYLGLTALVVLAILVILIVAGAIYQSVASARDLKKYPPPGKLYEIGDYRLHLYCTGEGSPTVILEAGSATPALTWHQVQKEVSGFTRVCSYDRAGFGWSDAALGPLSPTRVAADLHRLLATAGVPGPYILVGHSAGGLYNRAYAGQYPSEVAGLVFVDSVHEPQWHRWPADFVKMNKRSSGMYSLCKLTAPVGFVRLWKIVNLFFPENLTPADVRQAFLSTAYRTGFCRVAGNEVKAVFDVYDQANPPASLGDIPLIVLTRGISVDQEYAQLGAMQSMISLETLAKVDQANLEMQQELAGLSTRGKQVIATQSGHSIQSDQPELVIDAIRELVEQANNQ